MLLVRGRMLRPASGRREGCIIALLLWCEAACGNSSDNGSQNEGIGQMCRAGIIATYRSHGTMKDNSLADGGVEAG